MIPVLRVARGSDDFAGVLRFYREGLGFTVLARFVDHDGWDGLILGHARAPWHLEFTRHPDHPAQTPPGSDAHLVLDISEPDAFRHATTRMEAAGFASVPPLNPYWAERGRT